MREKEFLQVPKFEILDLLVCAEDYGFNHSILYNAFISWYGPITNEEIAEFANSFLDDGHYTEEDVEIFNERLIEIFSRFGEIKDA